MQLISYLRIILGANNTKTKDGCVYSYLHMYIMSFFFDDDHVNRSKLCVKILKASPGLMKLSFAILSHKAAEML